MADKEKPWLDMPIVRAAPAPAPKEDAPEPDPTMKVDEYGRPISGASLPAASIPTIKDIREAIAPEPGWVPSGVLPMATKEVSPGQGDPSAGVKWDWGPVRSVVNPVLDLLEGTGLSNAGDQSPLAGKVSPEATLLLLGAKAGNPNPFQSRNLLMEPGRDIRFGPATAPELGPLLQRDAPLPQEFLRDPMSPEAMTKIQETPPGTPVSGEPAARQQPPPEPTPEPGQPRPAPAGAQITPSSELGLTPREEAAYRSTAEGNKLLEPQEPGIRDNKQYLTGEKVNEAEASQDVEVARELKSLRQQTPELDKQLTADENHNNNLRTNAINNAIPGQVQITAAKTAREEAMKTAEPKVFGNATDADVLPIVKEIQDILNDPKNRQNTQLQQYVKPLIDRLRNPDGTPKIVDPKELWGWRQDVQHLTSGAAQRGDPNLSRVSGILGRVLDVTDNQLEAAASGYKQLLRDDYRARSREIDAMEALNAERFKLFDSQNKPNYNSVQGLMRRLTDARQANDPYEPFTHVQQETLDQLWNVRDSMRRTQAADRLAAPKGAPTSQNLGDALRAAGRMAIQTAAPAAGAGIGAMLLPGLPMVGSSLGLVAGTAVNHLLSERALAQRLARGQQLMNPNTLGPSP